MTHYPPVTPRTFDIKSADPPFPRVQRKGLPRSANGVRYQVRTHKGAACRRDEAPCGGTRKYTSRDRRPPPPELPLHRADAEAIRDELGAERSEELATVGRAMTLEEAVAEALSSTETGSAMQ